MTSKQLLSKLKHDKTYEKYIESLEKDLNELERLREDNNKEIVSNSLEAFDIIIDLLNRYQHTTVEDNEYQTIYGYPIDNIRKDLEVLVVLKKLKKNMSVENMNTNIDGTI